MSTLSIANKPISSLTVAELEILVADIVRRVVHEELRRMDPKPHNGDAIPAEFLATFGAWNDEKPAEEIVADIYESRTVSRAESRL